jgi:hypothetical protein
MHSAARSPLPGLRLGEHIGHLHQPFAARRAQAEDRVVFYKPDEHLRNVIDQRRVGNAHSHGEGIFGESGKEAAQQLVASGQIGGHRLSRWRLGQYRDPGAGKSGATGGERRRGRPNHRMAGRYIGRAGRAALVPPNPLYFTLRFPNRSNPMSQGSAANSDYRLPHK